MTRGGERRFGMGDVTPRGGGHARYGGPGVDMLAMVDQGHPSGPGSSTEGCRGASCCGGG